MLRNLVKRDEIKMYCHQFKLLSALRFFCAGLSQKILDPYLIPSYSQTGEDRILCHLLHETGFYVDVGCNHPQHYSNTFALYKKGWTGIVIDANEELIQKHQDLRSKDISVCAALSDQEKDVVFTDFEDSFVSSLDAAHIREWETKRVIKHQRQVRTVSLNKVLDSYKAPKRFDLLSIDVEGHDFEVLSSLDLNIYRPKLIVIEIHGFDFLNPHSNKIYEYLSKNGYKMIGYIVVNAYFVDEL